MLLYIFLRGVGNFGTEIIDCVIRLVVMLVSEGAVACEPVNLIFPIRGGRRNDGSRLRFSVELKFVTFALEYNFRCGELVAIQGDFFNEFVVATVSNVAIDNSGIFLESRDRHDCLVSLIRGIVGDGLLVGREPVTFAYGADKFRGRFVSIPVCVPYFRYINVISEREFEVCRSCVTCRD